MIKGNPSATPALPPPRLTSPVHHNAFTTAIIRDAGRRKYSFGAGYTGAGERRALAARQDFFVEIVDQLVEQPVPIDLGAQVPEHRTQPDCGAVHKDKGARRGDATEPANILVHAVDQPRSFGLPAPLLDRADAVVKQRAVDKSRPAVQH